MKAELLFHQKIVLRHHVQNELGIFEVIVWRVPKSRTYPDGVKYRAWLSMNGATIFGFDNHKPKGPHLHIGEKEMDYVYRGLAQLRVDILALIDGAGFYYEK